MLHITFEENRTSDIVDCILLMAPRFAALSAYSLKVSPQCEGIKQKESKQVSKLVFYAQPTGT